MIESTARAERVNLQSYSLPAFTWEAPGKPISVRMPFALIDRMEREVVENFRSLTSRGSEIGGILVGSAEPGSPTVVSVDDYEVISCDYSRGPLYRLSDADMGRFERAIEQRSAAGFQVVGFFRSHTRKGLSLDAEDLSFFTARFRDPSNVALLVRPFATKASTAGFFIWENESVQGENSYLEFPFRSTQLTNARPNGPVIEPAPAVNPAVSPAASAPPPAPAAPKPAVRAQIVPIASRREITLPVPPAPAEVKSEPKPAEQKPAPKPEARIAEPKQVESKPASPAPVVSPAPIAAVPAPVAAVPTPVQEQEVEKPKEQAIAPPVKQQPKEIEAEKPKEKAKEPEKVVEKAVEKVAETAPAKVPEKDVFAFEAEAKAPAGRGKGLVIGSIAVAVLAICAILFVYPGVLRHSGPSSNPALDAPSLSMRVERTGTDILLTWNRDSVAIQHASHAVLTISDGDRHENYDMDLSQLRNGSIVYSPLTADVSFRMEVTGQSNNKTASESVRVLRTRPSPMPDGSEPPADAAAAKPANAKPAPPANAAASTPNPADSGATDEPPVAPSKPATPTKAFNTASLAQRLRPATSADVPLPDAPTMNSAPVMPSSAPSFGAGTVAPAPVAPAPVAPPPSTPAPAAAPTPRKTAPPAATGGQIQQAQVIYSKQPEYPKLARQMGVKGTVEVMATIGTDGHVKAVRVEKGHPLLVKAATDAVMQWVYKPTLLNGTPVQNDTHITLNFTGDK